MNKELAECAQINFENLERALPFLLTHPYYIIAKAQLDESLGGVPTDEVLKRHIPALPGKKDE